MFHNLVCLSTIWGISPNCLSVSFRRHFFVRDIFFFLRLFLLFCSPLKNDHIVHRSARPAGEGTQCFAVTQSIKQTHLSTKQYVCRRIRLNTMIAAPTPPTPDDVAIMTNTNVNDDDAARRRGRFLRGEEDAFIKKSIQLRLSSASSRKSSSSSFSIRRRDVIKPLVLEEKMSNDNGNTATVAIVGNATRNKDGSTASEVREETNHERLVSSADTSTEAAAVVINNHDVSNGRGHHHHPEEVNKSNCSCTALVLHPLVVQHQKQHTPPPPSLRDPPGEAPTNHPIVCTDLMIVRGSGVGGGGGGSEYTYTDTNTNSNSSSTHHHRTNQHCYQSNVLWMDPKNVHHDPDLVDWNVLRTYDDLMSSSSLSSYSTTPGDADHSSKMKNYSHHNQHHHHHQQQQQLLLLSNPRTRIATISTGFKAAMFFVREDLDTRIYFHQLEDAIGYMGRRGYVKMRPQEEEEWRDMLEKAHKVVKVNM